MSRSLQMDVSQRQEVRCLGQQHPADLRPWLLTRPCGTASATSTRASTCPARCPDLVQEQVRHPWPDAGGRGRWTRRHGRRNLKTTYGGCPPTSPRRTVPFALADTRTSGAFSIADTRRAKQISLESFLGHCDAGLRWCPRTPRLDLMAARGPVVCACPVHLGAEGVRCWDCRAARQGAAGGVRDAGRRHERWMRSGLQDWVGKRVTSLDSNRGGPGNRTPPRTRAGIRWSPTSRPRTSMCSPTSTRSSSTRTRSTGADPQPVQRGRREGLPGQRTRWRHLRGGNHRLP